ncbi:MAG: PIN domain-containing protein [Prevotella sp.]|jgi:predicted nucleic acid-binding protein|nr:PIN domain-containing protein [Prevotella sp.]
MKKVFLDTNILMDFVENRKNREYAETIIELGKTGTIQLFASYLSFANMGYILRKRQQEERYRMIRNARKIVIVLPCDAAQLDTTLTDPVKDYEDMLQYQCALAAGCDVIVTNNKRDFQEFCQLPFLTSEEFLLQVEF